MLKFVLKLCEYNALHKQNYYQTPFIAIKMANSCSFSLRENLDLIDFKLFKFCDPGGILVVSKLASNIDDPNSNPVEEYSFFVKLLLHYSSKRPGFVQF